jgi:hypothetical protein
MFDIGFLPEIKRIYQLLEEQTNHVIFCDHAFGNPRLAGEHMRAPIKLVLSRNLCGKKLNMKFHGQQRNGCNCWKNF